MTLERIDLLRDAHRAELRHDARAHLGGHHVAEGIGIASRRLHQAANTPAYVAVPVD